MFKNSFDSIRIKLIVIFSFLITLSVFGKTFYVSTNGNNKNNGTIQSPFKTIQFGINHLQPGDKCLIRGGEYFENIKFTTSGTSKNKIYVSNYKGEHVIINPLKIPGKWNRFKNNIFRINVKDSVIQLFQNSKSLMQASFPNIEEGVMNTAKWNDVLAYPSKEVEVKNGDSLNLVNSHFIGICGNGLVALNGKVISQKNNKVLLENAGFFWAEKFIKEYLGKGKGFFVGKLEFLDAAGEWFYENGFLYYWPKSKHPSFDNLTIRYVKNTVIIDNQSFVSLSGVDINGGCIRLANSQHCTIKNTKITYPTPYFQFHSGFNRETPQMSKDPSFFEGKGVEVSGKYNRIENCVITKSWGDGLTIDGAFNRVENCRIEDCDWIGIDCAPLVIAGKNHLVIHNDFSHSGRSVVLHRKIKNSKILYNEIYDGGLLCDDLGMTYCYDSDGENTEIAYNWIHDNHAKSYGAGIYLDNMHQNYNVHHNVVWNCFIGITLNQPCKNDQIYNNTFWHNKYTMSSFHPIRGNYEMENIRTINNLTDSKLKADLHYPILGDYQKGNVIVEDIYEVLENPKQKLFSPHSNSKVGAYSSKDENWSAGTLKVKTVEKTYLSYLLFLLYFSFILLYLKKTTFVNSLNFRSKIILFLLKLSGAVSIYLVYTYYYPNRQTAEIFKHFDDAQIIYSSLYKAHFSGYVKFVFGTSDNNSLIDDLSLKLSFWKPATDSILNVDTFLIRLHCVINFFSFGFYSIHVLLFSFLSFLGSCFLYEVFIRYFKDSKRFIIVGLFCIPSVVFWTSGTIEDTLLLFFTGLICYSLMQISLVKKIGFNFFLLLLCGGSFVIIRPYLLVAFLPIISFLLLSFVTKKHPLIYIGLFNLGLLFLLLTIQLIVPSINFLTSITYVQVDLLDVASEMHAHSVIDVYPLNGTIESFIKAIPKAVWNVFLEPISMKNRSIVTLSYLLENVVILVLIIIAFIKRKEFSKQQLTGLTLVIFFCFIITLFIGWTLPIVGLISRYKAIFLPFLVTMIVLKLTKFKKLRA